jgi:hypothetical protein
MKQVTENWRSQRRTAISCDREDMPARRTWDDVKASMETENLSIGANDLGVGRKERSTRARGGES